MDIQNRTTMKEIWRDIKDYEGLYQVSNFGRVRSLPRMTASGMRGGKVLKLGKDKDGYLLIAISKNGKLKTFKVHRLVAEAFIPNPDSLPQVNHKDENPSNNFVFIREDGSADFAKSNLEWCNCKYNNNYGTHNERMAKTKSKPVTQKTKDGELIKIWSSAKEVERQTGWSHTNISACCRGIKKSAYNSIWEYID